MTPLQQALVDFIAAYVETQGTSPSTAEITRRFTSRNDATVVRALEGLAALGHLEQAHGRWSRIGRELQLHFPLRGDAPDGLP